MKLLKKIKSNKQKQLMKIDLLFILLCIIIYFVKSNPEGVLGTLKEQIQIITEFNINIGGAISLIAMTIFPVCFNIITDNFLWIAIYLFFRISRGKIIKENAKYEVIDNIHYFRETFKNITPAEISLVVDLEIETKKDLTATFVNLYKKGIIDFCDNKIIIVNENANIADLRNSEYLLVEMCRNNKIDIEKWKETAINEAIVNQLIMPRKKKTRQKQTGIKYLLKIAICSFVSVVALVFLLIFTIGKSIEGEKYMEEYNEYAVKIGIQEKDDFMTDYEILKSDEKLAEIYIKILNKTILSRGLTYITLGSGLLLAFWSVYSTLKLKLDKTINTNGYQRTNQGRIMVEQLAGIKNYIHDFSMLSEREKEEIKLWDDFLIYAIVLEENEKIVEDICTYKNVNIEDLVSKLEILNINI